MIKRILKLFLFTAVLSACILNTYMVVISQESQNKLVEEIDSLKTELELTKTYLRVKNKQALDSFEGRPKLFIEKSREHYTDEEIRGFLEKIFIEI